MLISVAHPEKPLSATNLNSVVTMNSGQDFRWRKLNSSPNEWIGVIGGNLIKVSSQDATLLGKNKRRRCYSKNSAGLKGRANDALFLGS